MSARSWIWRYLMLMYNTEQNNMSDSTSSEEMKGPVRLTSIAHGDMGMENVSPPTLSDMRALMERSAATERSLVRRIESIEEREQGQGGAPEPDQARVATSRRRISIIRTSTSTWRYEEFELPQSTYTLFITENVLSLSFFAGIIATALSVSSLSIVLINELNNKTPNSPFGMPAGVNWEVRTAQYLGVTIGVLMEEEVPLGLEIMGKCVEQGMLGRYPYDWKKVIFSSILRMVVGYLFLTCLFFTVIQESQVLNIFFDVLALEFVEKLDDAIYLLMRKGFFGKNLRTSSYKTYKYQPPGDVGTHTFANWMKRLIRVVYFFNAILMLFGLAYLSKMQDGGAFRCKQISVAFADDVWEESWVKLDDGSSHEKRLLIYSHFNGIYVENGTSSHGNHPRYTEQNKENGKPFRDTIGAEIIYCKLLGAWVFRHDLMSTSPFDQDEENECSWLLRSPPTDSYDIIEVGTLGAWMVWTGQIEPESSVAISCNKCYDSAGCNYHGDCMENQCRCHSEQFGIHCEFDRPCDVIRSSKDENATLDLVYDTTDDDDTLLNFVQVYGHPKYSTNLASIPTGFMKMGDSNDDAFGDDDFFEIHNQMESFQELLVNYTFVLRYTGRRWYGQILPPGLDAESFVEEEYHAFWKKSFSGFGVDDNATVIISAPTTHASPVGVDFYEMRRRNKQFETGAKNYNYGPFGVLINMVGTEGAGYFHCNDLFIAELLPPSADR